MDRQSTTYHYNQLAETIPFEEPSDFPVPHHPAVSSASPPSYHAFERAFCSNFTCCGQSLPDLHVLLDHCEQFHPSVWGSDPINESPVYSAPSHRLIMSDYRSSLSPSPSPCSKSINISTSDRSVSPSSANVSEYFHALSPFGDLGALMLAYNTHEFDEDGPLTLSKTIVDCEFEFEFHKSQVGEDFLDGFDDEVERKEVENPSLTEATISVGQEEPPFADTSSSTTATTTAIEVHPVFSPDIPCEKGYPADLKPKRGNVTRERTFKCPRPGCIKAYLNPNGLKYHADRGTCEFVSTGAKQ